jgi:hypothetical protein
VVIELSRKVFRILEVGVSYFGKSYSGQKITWKDGISGLR